MLQKARKQLIGQCQCVSVCIPFSSSSLHISTDQHEMRNFSKVPQIKRSMIQLVSFAHKKQISTRLQILLKVKFNWSLSYLNVCKEAFTYSQIAQKYNRFCESIQSEVSIFLQTRYTDDKTECIQGQMYIFCRTLSANIFETKTNRVNNRYSLLALTWICAIYIAKFQYIYFDFVYVCKATHMKIFVQFFFLFLHKLV